MEERRRTQRRRKDRDSIVGGPRIIASDHPAVNGLSDTHEGRGHACKGIRMQGRVSPCTRTNAWVNGWPWVGESLRRGQKRRERNPFWRLPLTTLSLSLCVSVRGVVQLSLRLFVSCVLRLEFALTDWLWLVVHPFANSRWSRSLLWVEYNGWDETKPRLLFFFSSLLGLGQVSSFSFPFLSSKFVWIENLGEFEQPCFNFVSKFGEVFSFFFFVRSQLLEQPVKNPFGFLFFNGEVGCSKRGCTANQSGTIFFERFDSMSYYIK